MALLEISGASKRFGAVTAVDRVFLSIERGEFFALLGPSGCGKTTLLRLIAGFETPNEGRIVIDGTDITAVPPYARPVNMMFQSYALFPHLDVAGNIAFGLKQEGMPRQRRAARVEEMLALVVALCCRFCRRGEFVRRQADQRLQCAGAKGGRHR